MLLGISALSFVFSAAEYFGYGPALARFLDRVRVQSMQISLRNGEINPKITEVIHALAGIAMTIFMLATLAVAAIVLPLLVIYGKDATSSMISGKGPAYLMLATVFGPMAFLLGVGVLYVAWCAIVDLLARGLTAAHQTNKGTVATVGFAIGALSFALDRIFS